MSVGALFLSGCDKASPDPAEARFDDSAVLLKVGSNVYTEAAWQLDRGMLVELALIRGCPSDKREELEQRAQSSAAVSAIQLALNRLLLDSDVRARGLEVSKSVCQRIERGFSRRIFGKPDRFDEAASVFSTDERALAFGRMVDGMKRAEGMIAKYYEPGLKVTDEDVAATWKSTCDYNATADKTNAVIQSKAEMIVRRARAGEDFGKLADLYSEEPNKEPGGDAGELRKDDFAYDKPGVWTAVVRLRDGEISDPVDSEEGLTVFKLVKFTPKAKTEDQENDVYHLQRIILHRMVKASAADDVAVRMELERQARREMERKFKDDLAAGVKLEFPSGFGKFPDSVLRVLADYSKEVPKPKGMSMQDIVRKARERQGKKK